MNALLEPLKTKRDEQELLYRKQTRIRRLVTRVFRFTIGVLLTQYALGELLVAGWVRRMMQRTAYRQWWRMAGKPQDEAAFIQAVGMGGASLVDSESPRWLLHEHPRAFFRRHAGSGVRGFIKGASGAVAHSFWTNLRGGIEILIHTFVLTAPATILWAFSWRYGWDNSFTFGYEQSDIGPSLGLLGVVLFIVAMCYVPMAQARLAAAEQWRAFYDVRLISHIIYRKWPALLLLAVLYFLLSIPIMGMKVLIPYTLEETPGIETMTNEEVANVLNARYLAMGAVGLFGYLLLHLRAARIYASGLAIALREGDITADRLTPSERAVFGRFGLLKTENSVTRHPASRFVRKATGRPAFIAGLVLTMAVWFGVVAQIYVGQFLNYVPVRGWLNQPMIQAPWFNYTPGYLDGTDGEPPLPDAVFKK